MGAVKPALEGKECVRLRRPVKGRLLLLPDGLLIESDLARKIARPPIGPHSYHLMWGMWKS
jgi:hypothetical protein